MTNKVDWSKAPKGAEFYADSVFCKELGGATFWWDSDKKAWLNNIGVGVEDLMSFDDYQKRPEQITEIRVGDYIHKDELDTEEKYNDVARVFGRFSVVCPDFAAFKDESDSLTWLVIHDGELNTRVDTWLECKRQLTYEQIMPLDKKEHVDVDNCNIDKVVSIGGPKTCCPVEGGISVGFNFTEVENGPMQPLEFKAPEKQAVDDQVKSPSHYQLMEGVESIEIIARSMTQAEWKGFCLGNMLKYRIRAGKKENLQQDIDKANFYGELYEMHRGKCYDA